MENNLICGVSLCAHALVVKGEEGGRSNSQSRGACQRNWWVADELKVKTESLGATLNCRKGWKFKWTSKNRTTKRREFFFHAVIFFSYRMLEFPSKLRIAQKYDLLAEMKSGETRGCARVTKIVPKKHRRRKNCWRILSPARIRALFAIGKNLK